MLHKSSSLLPVLILVGLLVISPYVGAQPLGGCPVDSTYVGMTFTQGMSATFVFKYLTTTYTCGVSMSMNVINCGGGVATSILSATAFTTATNPSCGFDCGACSETIDTSDGLPVELMDFSVEGSEEEAK